MPTNKIDIMELGTRGGRVRCKVVARGTPSRYLQKGPLEFAYDLPVERLDKAVLYIPIVAAVLPVAWLTGADVSVRELDSRYVKSLMLVQRKMKEWRPELPFSTSMAVEESRNSAFAGKGKCGLLYSCGLDSTASYLRNKGRISTLIMFGGTEDMPLRDKKYWHRVCELASSFAKTNSVSLHVVETNMLEQVRVSLLAKDFSALLAGTNHPADVMNWEGIFRAVLLGMAAPVSAGAHLEALLMAPTVSAEVMETLGLHPIVEETLAWGDLTVIQDSRDFTRQEKIRRFIAPYVKSGHGGVPLRVCHPINLENYRRIREAGALNCCNCHKCVRTILGLAMEGVDPQACGFDRENFSADGVRRRLMDRTLLMTKTTLSHWNDLKLHIQNRPSEAVASDIWETNTFFDWLSTYDLTRNLAANTEPLEWKRS